jgi:hypothetical protein
LYETDTPFHDVQYDIGVDIKYHGYIVIAPSSIDEKEYQWVKYGTPNRIKVLPSYDRVKKEPEIVVEDNSDDDAIRTMMNVITNGSTDGRHNEQVRDLARLLVRGMNSDTGFKHKLAVTMLHALDQRDPTPQGIEQLKATYEQAYKYEANRMGLSESGTQPQVDGFNTINVYEAIAQYHDYDVTYLIDTWLPENSFLMLIAPPETFKTWLLLDMAVSLSHAEKANAGFLDVYPVQENDGENVPVLLVQQEDYIGLLSQRLRTITDQRLKGVEFDFYQSPDGRHIVMETPYSAPLHMYTDAQLTFDNDNVMNQMEQFIKKEGIRQVFIDPFYSLSGDTSNYFSDAAAKMNAMKQIRNKYNCGFLFAHHTTKSSGGNDRTASWGSQLLNGATEGFLISQNVANAENTIKLKRQGKFFPDKTAVQVEFDIDTSPTDGHYKTTIRDADFNGSKSTAEQIDEIHNHLMAVAVEGMTPTEVKEMFGYNSVSTAQRRLKHLEDNGDVVNKEGRYIHVNNFDK